MGGGAWRAAIHGVDKSQTGLSDFTFTFHFHALEKEMATHSSVLAWRIPGTGEPGGLPSLGSHRIRHNWRDLAVAAAAAAGKCSVPHLCPHTCAKLPISPVCAPMPRPCPISLRSESLGIGFRQLVFLRLPRWLQGTANFKHHWFRIFACLLPYFYALDFFKFFFFKLEHYCFTVCVGFCCTTTWINHMTQKFHYWAYTLRKP